jgi:hypothetical protein
MLQHTSLSKNIQAPKKFQNQLSHSTTLD